MVLSLRSKVRYAPWRRLVLISMSVKRLPIARLPLMDYKLSGMGADWIGVNRRQADNEKFYNK